MALILSDEYRKSSLYMRKTADKAELVGCLGEVMECQKLLTGAGS